MNRKRVIFVDDEVNVLNGLRRMLRRAQTDWDMVFVTRAEEALAEMTTSHFDVVVTDIRMPGMDGADLLEHVYTSHPNMARIVLSGHATTEPNTKALRLAHQYLAKPVDAETLKHAVACACSAQQSVDDEHIQAIVSTCGALPSPPILYADITRVAESEGANARQIAEVICRDVSMSGKLLQLVNSSFFGIGRRVSSVEQAVALLGVVRIRALVLSEEVFKQFQPSRAVEGFSLERLWQHSLEVAEVARLISKAEKQSGDRPDQAFTAGVVHDIGHLVFLAHQADRFDRARCLATSSGKTLQQAESEVLGADHARVGGYLLGLWGLPPRIVEAVALHHTPSEITYDGLCALTVVHVADALVLESEAHRDEEGNAVGGSGLDAAYLERTGFAARLDTWRELVGRVCAAHG